MLFDSLRETWAPGAFHRKTEAEGNRRAENLLREKHSSAALPGWRTMFSRKKAKNYKNNNKNHLRHTVDCLASECAGFTFSLSPITFLPATATTSFYCTVYVCVCTHVHMSVHARIKS